MQRRSAVGRLATAVAGLSLARVPALEGAAVPGRSFSVRNANLPDSPGLVTCSVCEEMGDSLALTPAGVCLRCADRSPLKAEPNSDPFWILSPGEVRRVEREIDRLAAELERMSERLGALQQEQITSGDSRYDVAVEAERDQWHALQRELHLLQLLRAASRQFAS